MPEEKSGRGLSGGEAASTRCALKVLAATISSTCRLENIGRSSDAEADKGETKCCFHHCGHLLPETSRITPQDPSHKQGDLVVVVTGGVSGGGPGNPMEEHFCIRCGRMALQISMDRPETFFMHPGVESPLQKSGQVVHLSF